MRVEASYGTVEIQGRVYEKFWWYKKGTPWPVGPSFFSRNESGSGMEPRGSEERLSFIGRFAFTSPDSV